MLADARHPAFGMGTFGRFPAIMDLLKGLPESFRTGIGHDYDAHGPEGAAGVERSFEPWYRNFLVPVALPALDGVVDKLEAGATAADVGCGAGVAVRLMAERVPGQHVPRLRHLAARAASGPSSGGPTRASPTPASTTPARTRCRPTTASTW